MKNAEFRTAFIIRYSIFIIRWLYRGKNCFALNSFVFQHPRD